ncbi:hypothetical protein VNO78_34894 [Psophocarpus tetragonolobus]|uniref:Uncharacterized protein n=1 Tax=Psophocarpus tetragonolobus TaxID=3891 RepID=A0AAN9NUR9_PSOTE
MNVSGTYTKWVMEYKTGRCTHAIGLEQHSSTILSRHTLCHELNFSTNRDTTITGGQHTPSQHNTAVVLHETFALSHFATFFIDARAEISVAESHFASCVVTTPAGHRLRVPKNRPLQFQFPWHTKRRGSVDFSQRRGQRTAHVAAIRTLHRTIQSVGATGGVYKGQGRASGVLKATSADPWSASFMVETRTVSDRLRAPNFRS